MKGITTFIVMVGMLGLALLVGIPVMDEIAPLAQNMAPQHADQVSNIHVTVVKWIIPVFIGTMLLWAVFWILRQERQTV